ncbi:MAG TPA: outer membrane beta-barrel protein [Vicinamibacterales bacterium]|nr:outer membrane beta-barrel protein [Vicinamibacterales bacterium]
MKRTVAAVVTALALTGATRAWAQEIGPGPATLEVTIIPAGGTFFVSRNNTPSFGNYNLGGSVAYNVNSILGFEGEVNGSLGIAQDLAFGASTSNLKTPNTLNYTGNVVLSAPTHSSLVPYLTGGVGGQTVFQRAELGINSTQTFLTGNAGAGVKWYAANGRWGLRGDYRFIAVRAADSTPAFFGPDARFANRVYAGVIINAIR